MIDEPRADTPEEEGLYRCHICGELVPMVDSADHLEGHSEDESLERKRPLPNDPMTRAFWEGWTNQPYFVRGF